MPRGSPEWQSAKPLLEQDYLAVEGIVDMTPDQVIALRPEIYGKVKRTNFVNNWKTLKERMKANKDNPQQGRRKKASGPTAWEIAKKLLEEDYDSGKATADMTYDEVVALRKTIYGKVPKTNFVNNWRSLKNRINTEKAQALKDRADLDHDAALYLFAKDLPWEWHGSDAERHLKKDVANGRHKRYHPSVLFLKRKSYQKFDYQIFRKHIHQETRSLLETPYWMVQKEKKQAKKKEIQEAVELALEEAEKAEMEELQNAFANIGINNSNNE